MPYKIWEQETLLDKEDAHFLDAYKWSIERQENNCVYFKCKHRQPDGAVKTLKLHRLIAGATWIENGFVFNRPHLIDHMDHNTLNNLRSNLRPCTKAQNAMNSKIRRDSSSGYRGVCWQENRKKWRVYIIRNQRQTHIGYFDTAIEAAKARIEKAREVFGEFFTEGIERIPT